MRRLSAVLGLELYAVLLACVQYLNGVRTDEAKYLLSIPYPHPPLARFFFHVLDGWTSQEFFLRFLLASLVVQSVWLFLSLIENRTLSIRFAAAVAFLASGSVLYEAGLLMMAVLTGLQAFVFTYWWMKKGNGPAAAVIGLWWLVSLFTAYQIVLFTPLVVALLWRQESSLWKRAAAFLVPLVVIGLYTLSNPLIIASLLLHADQATFGTRLWELLLLWLFSGGIVLSLGGLYGIVRFRLLPVLLSLLLVAAYISVARFSYYAILFLPLSLAGVAVCVRVRPFIVHLFAVGALLSVIIYLVQMPILTDPSPARRVMQIVASTHLAGPVLINGTYGHEWQYESRLPVYQYRSDQVVTSGSVVVCLSACPTIDADPQWVQISPVAPFIYERAISDHH